MIDKKIIKNLVLENFEEIVNIREYLHKNPELSFKEYKTSKYISQFLHKNKIKHKFITQTGILAIIEGERSQSNKNIVYRADIDALPIQEKNKVKYKSKNKGIMHACGHDVHTSSLLYAAKILNTLKHDLSGKIYFIFQPGEELIPGGAKMILDKDIFNGIKIDSIYAQHVFPDLKMGQIGYSKNAICASGDEIRIKIIGKGGHASKPHKLIDPISVSSNILIALQNTIHKYKPINQLSILSFGKIIGLGATNIIPDEVNIEGTFRAFDEKWRKKAHNLINKIAKGLANSFGAKCIVDISKGYPPLINDRFTAEKFIKYSKDYLGEKKIVEITPQMFSEDFAYFAQKYPSCFYLLGTQSNKINNSGLHTSTFDIDKEVLKDSVGMICWLITQDLNN